MRDHRPGAHVGAAQERYGFLVVNLISDLSGLRENSPAGFGVSIDLKIFSFIDETLAVGVDHHTVRVRIAGTFIGSGFHRGSVGVDDRGMAAAPVAERAGADVRCYLDTVSRVVARAADFHEVPILPQVASAHFGIGLKSATGEYDGFASDFLFARRR